MKPYITLLTADRRSVGCSLAFFVGARLERSLNAKGEEGKTRYRLEHTPHRSPRADGLVLSDALARVTMR
jgi:hypothetical protein